MASQDKNTQTEQYSCLRCHYIRLKLSNVLKFMSSLLLPLTLGIFTIIVTFHQQEVARQQRVEDRRASELQRELERNLDEQRYKNNIFGDYIKEMGKLLKESNGSLTTDEVITTLSRANTLNIFRQLDGQRNTRIIRFLHEAKQLSETFEHVPLDLSTANLYDIDFRNLAIDGKKLTDFSLVGVFLSNITLFEMEIRQVNFARTHFDNATFSFEEAHNVNFSSTRLSNVNFSSSQLDRINFSSAKLYNANFSVGDILHVNLRSSSLDSVDFSSATLYKAVFTTATVVAVNFSFAILNNADFSFASLTNVDFSYAKLINVNFSRAILRNITFSCAELSYPDLSYSQLSNVDFSFAVLVLPNFHMAKASYANFRQSTIVEAHFNSSTLSNSNFLHSDLKKAFFTGASLIDVHFHYANLYKAKFMGVSITQDVLENALSIQELQITEEEYLYDTNLINNCQLNSNASSSNVWILTSGNITQTISNKNDSTCSSTLQSLTSGATMLQRITNLSNKWDSNTWPYSYAMLSANMSIGVSIELRGINKDNVVVVRKIFNSTKKDISLLLQEDISELQVFVEFSVFNNRNDAINFWCDKINLIIIYGSYLEFLKILPTVPDNTRWKQSGEIVAGGNGEGEAYNQTSYPVNFFLDEKDHTLFIPDAVNSRIIEWRVGDDTGKVIVGNQGEETSSINPNDIFFDKTTDSLLICDQAGRQVLRWPHCHITTKEEVLISDINCFGLTLDDQGFLYISDNENHEVRRYEIDEKNGILVAGGHGKGDRLNQLNEPNYIFVDRQQTIYISDGRNHRIMKWNKGSKSGIIVAGGHGEGNSLSQLKNPRGLFVDTLGTVYIADYENDRIMCWSKGMTQGRIIIGENGRGNTTSQFDGPVGLSFDRYGALFVTDYNNNRVLRFSIEESF